MKMCHDHNVVERFCCRLLCEENFSWAQRKTISVTGWIISLCGSPWQVLSACKFCPVLLLSFPAQQCHVRWAWACEKERIVCRMPQNLWLHLASWVTRISVGRESSCSLGLVLVRGEHSVLEPSCTIFHPNSSISFPYH